MIFLGLWNIKKTDAKRIPQTIRIDHFGAVGSDFGISEYFIKKCFFLIWISIGKKLAPQLKQIKKEVPRHDRQ